VHVMGVGVSHSRSTTLVGNSRPAKCSPCKRERRHVS
jgi:hypothetical protein